MGLLAVPAAASILLAARLGLALALIPPWQQPDEPSHVALVQLERSRIALLDGTPDAAREAAIMQSMADHDWWEHRARGLDAPIAIPTSFDRATLRSVVPPATADPSLYFKVVSRLLGWTPELSVVGEMYLLRALSALLALLTLWVAWFAARVTLDTVGAATVVALLAVHPQFTLASTAASPDPTVNFLGAAVWWMGVVAVRRTHTALALAAVWTAAVAAAWSDRVGLPLLGIALLTSLAAARAPLAHWRPRPAIAAATLLGAASVVVASAALVGALRDSYTLNVVFSGELFPVPGAVNWDRFVRFTTYLYQSWWFAAGWMTYQAPAWWQAIVGVVTVMGISGVALTLLRRDGAGGGTRGAVLLAAGFLAIQMAAIYWAYFRLDNGAQGRYLFPVLVPSLVLLWAGVDAWVPRSQRAYAAAALVLLVGLLDAAAWILVVVPVYYESF